MNAKEVAKLLGVHPNTVYNMIRSGEIKAEKKGRSFEIPESEVKQLKHSKGIENLAKAQERATMQLIVNINSEIEAELSQLEMYAGMVKKEMQSIGILQNDYSNESFEKRRKLYEEDEHSTLSQIVTISKNISRLEYLKKELEQIAKDNENKNTFEKANEYWRDFISNSRRFERGSDNRGD